MDMEQAERELKRREERMEIEAAEKAKKKNKESLLDDLVRCTLSHSIAVLLSLYTDTLQLIWL